MTEARIRPEAKGTPERLERIRKPEADKSDDSDNKH